MARIQEVSFWLLLLARFAYPQEWGWLDGENVSDVISTTHYPGSRSGSSVWQDTDGQVWLFGGKGFTDVGKELAEPLNDLWRYNITRGKWTLVHPGTVSTSSNKDNSDAPSPRYQSSSCGVTGITFVVYGGIGEEDKAVGDTWVYYIKKNHWLPLTSLYNFTSEENDTINIAPSPRGDTASWCLHDSMYIFGGTDHNKVVFTDMWKFSLKALEWLKISKISKRPARSSSRYPAGRNGATTWVGLNQTLYMFGGNTLSTNVRSTYSNLGYTSDLWSFSVTEKKWTFLTGYVEPRHPGIYGKEEKPSKDNNPGCRSNALAWVDTSGHLWMFGGDGTGINIPSVFHPSELLSDLWRYLTDGQMWVWMGGSKQSEADAVYMEKGKISGRALPGGRSESVGFVGKQNKFYMFGGVGHDGHRKDGYLNDLWIVDVDKFVGFHTKIAPGYVFLLIFTGVGLTVALVVISMYARDRQGINQWGPRLDYNVKYSQLGESVD